MQKNSNFRKNPKNQPTYCIFRKNIRNLHERNNPDPPTTFGRTCGNGHFETLGGRWSEKHARKHALKMDTQTIIMAVAASLGIPAPETLSKCKIDKLCDFNIRYLSLLTFFAHAYESGQMSEQRIITIVRDWEERSGFAIASRETVYRIKNYLFQVVLGNRATVAGKGFWSKGFPLIPKNAVQTERN